MRYRLRRVYYWVSNRVVYLRIKLTGKYGDRKLPRKGDWLYACCGKPNYKQVKDVDILGDNIEYEDGACDSFFHCGWQWTDPDLEEPVNN